MTNPTRSLVAVGAAVALATALAACGGGSSTSSTTSTTDQSSPAAMSTGSGSMANSSSMKSAPGSNMTEKGGDRFGGPSFKGAPNLAATAALVKAGGGAANFSTATALTSMVGGPTVSKEVAKLTKQYGKAETTQFLKTFDYAVTDSLKVATAAGVKLPAPAPVMGKALAAAVVKSGTTSDGTFWTGWMLDHAVSNKIHDKVMDDIDKKYGVAADANYHKISNQAFYDLAQALGATNVKLAAFH